MNIASETSIVIRDIDAVAEMHAVEELQKEVWGIPDIEVVPVSQLTAAKHAGGVLIGAFDREMMVGFAYGFVGHEFGTTVHHSHMLAVRPEYRAHDLGFRLKAAQRERVLAQGIELMTWTFDPLQSLNAYFNFNKLGVIADKYFVNFYGEDAASFLHRNGTDRLWVTWRLASEIVSRKIEKTFSNEGMPIIPALVEVGENERPNSNDLNKIFAGDRVAIEIPGDINSLEQESSELAELWRKATRSAFTMAFADGFVAEDFHVKGTSACRIGVYVLKRISGSNEHE